MSDVICPNCKHSIDLHNEWNCTYSFEKAHECHCGWTRALIQMAHERDEALKILNRPDVQKYLAWWNANQND